jgi:hypothetical protein
LAHTFSFNINDFQYDLIPTHRCTEEDKKKFYQPNKVFLSNFDMVFTELYCITNPENLIFFGDFNGDVAAGIYLSFEECNSQTNEDCLSEEGKKEFFAH